MGSVEGQDETILERVMSHPGFLKVKEEGDISVVGHIVHIHKPFDESPNYMELFEYYVNDDEELVFKRKVGKFTDQSPEDAHNYHSVGYFNYNHVVFSPTGEKIFDGTYEITSPFEIGAIYDNDPMVDKFHRLTLNDPVWNIRGPLYIGGKQIGDGIVKVLLPDFENPDSVLCIRYMVKKGSEIPYNVEQTSVSSDDYTTRAPRKQNIFPNKSASSNAMLDENMTFEQYRLIMSERNLGALSIFEEMPYTDYALLHNLDRYGVRGVKLWCLYDKCCSHDYELFKLVMIMFGEDRFSQDDIDDNLDPDSSFFRPFVSSEEYNKYKANGFGQDSFENWNNFCDSCVNTFSNELNKIREQSKQYRNK